MVKSMTGYGKYSQKNGDITVVCEIKSLNGKVTDLRLKSSVPLADKELEVRNLILDGAKRGKVEANIMAEGDIPLANIAFDAPLIRNLYSQLKPIFEETNEDVANVLPSILRMPHVLQNQTNELDANLWGQIKSAIQGAIVEFDKFRTNEGDSIQVDLDNSVHMIEENLAQIDPFDLDRKANLRERLKQRMEEYLSNESVDQNRFEQEVLYYLEKLDINEEKVRLKQHCEHFQEVLKADGDEKGKKLAFISQEMGREINTMGAKAQWTPIQRHVVEMKNELEKIKEQLANTV